MKIRFDFLACFVLLDASNILGSEIEYDLRFLQDRDVTYAELETHTTFEVGLWTAFNGVVYDITNYKHPGGQSYLLYAGGIEGDDIYLNVDKKYHYLSIADVVKEDGIVRIGPLVSGAPPPTASVSPASPVEGSNITEFPTPTSRSSKKGQNLRLVFMSGLIFYSWLMM
jgi:hypothetical protein